MGNLETDLKDYYKAAIFAENRHDYNLARHYYHKFYDEIKCINDDLSYSFNWYRIAAFFYDHGDFETAIYFAKKDLLSGRNECLPLYVLACQNFDDQEKELEWLLPYVVKFPFFKQSCTYFMMIAKYKDIYTIVLDTFEKIEDKFFQGSLVESNQYIDYLQLLIDLEIKEEKMPNARFYLRKWLLLESPYLNRINDMIIYAIYLDDLPTLLKRKNLMELLERADEESILFFNVARQLIDHSKITRELENIFINTEFSSSLLREKQDSYKKLIQALNGGDGLSLPKRNDWTEYKAYILANGLSALEQFERDFKQFADIEEAITLYSIFVKQTKQKPDILLDDLSVTVLGGGDKIGGSCIVLTIGDSHLMIDAGGFVDAQDSQYINFSLLDEKGISLNDIDGLLVTHAHIDHIGSLPHLYNLCSTIPIYATPETKQLMWLMLREQEKYDPSLTKSGLIDKCMIQVQTMKKNVTVKSQHGDWHITLIEAGHIQGAVSLLIEKNGKTIFVTGDYSIENQRTVKGLKLPKKMKADIVITETTYGYYPTSASLSRKRQEEMFIDELLAVIKRGGTVLIPAFALGRAQEIISIIQQHLKELWFPVYIDGMVCQITELYHRFLKEKDPRSNPLLGHGIIVAKEFYKQIGFDQFVTNIVSKEPCCIIASSGMLYEGTKSSAYAKRLIADPKNAIVFTGYLDEESPGFVVSNSSSSIVIDGEKKEINAEILSLRLSAHANREEIVQTITSLNPKHVILVHGDSDRVYQPEKMIDSPFPTVAQLLKVANINVIQSKNGETYQF